MKHLLTETKFCKFCLVKVGLGNRTWFQKDSLSFMQKQKLKRSTVDEMWERAKLIKDHISLMYEILQKRE